MTGTPSSKTRPPSAQVEHLERHLRRPLFDIADYEREDDPADLSEFEYRKCYRLDPEGNVIELNLWQCRISDGSFLKDLSQLQSLNLGANPISDG